MCRERLLAAENQLRAAEKQLAELRGSCENTKSALAIALESERRAAEEAEQLRTELSTTNNALLQIQVRRPIPPQNVNHSTRLVAWTMTP